MAFSNPFKRIQNVTLAQIFHASNISGTRRYIVSTRKEHHQRNPPYVRTSSRTKSAKRTRCKAKRRSHRA
jgi:hypothetical protein